MTKVHKYSDKDPDAPPAPPKPKTKGKGSGLTPFKPGQSGNPKGRPPLPRSLKVFRHTTYVEFLEKLQLYGAMTREELAAELRRPDASNFELIFGKLIFSAAKGDTSARKEILERLWGKVKDSLEISHREIDERLERVNQDKIIELLREAKG